MHDRVAGRQPARKRRQQPTKSPTKAAYDEAFPTFSARIPRDLFTRAKKLQAVSGKTFAAILAEAIDRQEAAAGAAYDRGRADAIRKFAVPFPCCGCGKLLYFSSSEGFAVVADFLRTNGWGHEECVSGT